MKVGNRKKENTYSCMCISTNEYTEYVYAHLKMKIRTYIYVCIMNIYMYLYIYIYVDRCAFQLEYKRNFDGMVMLSSGLSLFKSFGFSIL